MRILLTGATGFIGKPLLHKLLIRYGYESVAAISSHDIPGVTTYVYSSHSNLDFDSDDFSDIEILIHVGAFIPKSGRDANNINGCNSNIEFTSQLLGLKFSQLKKVINISTVDVYGNSGIIDESSPVSPASLYGMSKLYCERIVSLFCEGKAIEQVTLRIGHVYGPGEESYQKLIPVSMNRILQTNKVELWGEGSELRSYIFINDVVDSIANAVEMRITAPLINCVSANVVSIQDIVRNLIEISAEDVELVRKPSNYRARNLVFNNTLLKSTLLDKEKSLFDGLAIEFEYMRKINEHNF